MKGMQLCEQFYKEYGEPMLRQFPDLLPYLAAGLIGSGSECCGYDDAISHDHDFEPGFCIFLPGEDLVSAADAFRLERAYSKLPVEFMGFKRNRHWAHDSRHGVIRIDDFMRQKIGGYTQGLPLNAWLYIEEQFFLEVTNGKLFMDNLGVMTEIRKNLTYLPEDVRLKKLAGNLMVMDQSGQYNYSRCVERGETGAAQLALTEFVKASMQTIFLLNKQYMPYYKWRFRALRDLGVPSDVYQGMEYLLSSDNTDKEFVHKLAIVDRIVEFVVHDLMRQQLSLHPTNRLDIQASLINDKIKDIHIRSMHIMAAV